MKLSIADLIIPIVLILVIVVASAKKVNVYGSFLEGAKESVPLAVNLFPYVASVFILIDLMRESGLITFISTALSPLLVPLGVPEELLPLIVVKPFSGGGSLAVLEDVLARYGADSYIGRCAAVVSASSETVFYISAVYFAGTGVRRLGKPIILGLVVTYLSVALSCLVCRIC